jgi:hypothetical protein
MEELGIGRPSTEHELSGAPGMAMAQNKILLST